MSMGASSGYMRDRQTEQQLLQREQIAKADALQKEQAKQVADREDRTAASEDAQRLVRGRKRRGLLAYTEDQALGGSA